MQRGLVKLYAKAARAQSGWSGLQPQLFIKLVCGYSLNAGSSELTWQQPAKPTPPCKLILKHITVTLATWDVVWEVYLDPKWLCRQRRLYGDQDRALEQFFKKPDVVAPRILPQAARIQPGSHTGSSLRPSTPPPAKRTKAEQAAEPTQPTKGTGQGCRSQTSTTAS
ncbi:hypothetical protein QJQ45_006973 [Haematococcus lacustris]|nr:hypothetical protein QJQ45_006973 [Haematococcus lacustris]